MSNPEVLGRFVWHELLTQDTAAAAAFYSKVLSWRTAPSNVPGYTIFMSGQTQIGGLMAHPTEAGGAPPHWLIYIGTPDVDATCSKAHGLGARICKDPADIPNVGRYAVLADPQGATFALFTPGAGAPPQAPTPERGGFSWHELATPDVAGALRFYGELFGWKKGPGHDMGNGMGVYQIIEHGGTQVGGLHAAQGPASAPAWLSYVHVADCDRAVAAAKAGGGRLLHGPMEVPGGSWIALMTDPQGGAFAVQEAPKTAASQPKATPPTLKAAPPPKPPGSPKPPTAPKTAASAPAANAAPAARPQPPKAATAKAPPKAAKKKAKPAAGAKKAVKSKPRRKAQKKKAAHRKAKRKVARRPARRKGKARPARRAKRARRR